MRELCGTCSTKTCPVPQFSHPQPVRVCDACFSHLGGHRNRCIARLVPYIERDSTTEAKRMEALGEVHELLTSGVELLEEARSIGLMGPLMHVASQSNFSSASAIKALAIIALVTDLDEAYCPLLAAVPETLKRLIEALQTPAVGNQSRLLIAQIIHALARTKEVGLSIIAAGYLGPLNIVLSGQYADAKLVDSFVETAVLLCTHDPTFVQQLSVSHLLSTLANGSATCQRATLLLLTSVPPAAILHAEGGAILVPLMESQRERVMPLLRQMAALPEGPQKLLRAGVLKHLAKDHEEDALVIVLSQFEAEPLAKSLLPCVCDLPNAGTVLLERKQLSKLTALLGDHYTEEYKLSVLQVLSVLAAADGAEMAEQMVKSGAFYDLITHMSLVGTSPALHGAQLSVLHTILTAHPGALMQAADSGAIQALWPLVRSGVPTLKTVALLCLVLICEATKEACVLFVAVASPGAFVGMVQQDPEVLTLTRVLLQNEAARADLMAAGIFPVLMALIGSQSHSKETRSLAGVCVGFCMTSQLQVDERYIDSVRYLLLSDPALGIPLVAAFSAQPVYLAAIISRGIPTTLVQTLNAPGLAPATMRDTVVALSNVLAHDEEAARVILADGALDTLIRLSSASPDEPVQGLSTLCIGNVAQFPLTRQAAIASGAIESVQGTYEKSTSKILDHYCMWALRMLLLEPGAASHITGTLNMEKLAIQCAARDEHAVAFCESYIPWAVERSLGDVKHMQTLLSTLAPSLIAPHVVRLMPRSASMLLMMCELGGPSLDAIHAAGALQPLADALNLPEACRALTLLAREKSVDALVLKEDAGNALLEFYRGGGEVSFVLLSRLQTSKLIEHASLFVDVLFQTCSNSHALALLARIIGNAELRTKFVAHADAVKSVVSAAAGVDAAEIVFRCSFEPTFVSVVGGKEAVVPFAQRCIQSNDELVVLRGLEITHELNLRGSVVLKDFQNPLLKRLAMQILQ